MERRFVEFLRFIIQGNRPTHGLFISLLAFLYLDFLVRISGDSIASSIFFFLLIMPFLMLLFFVHLYFNYMIPKKRKKKFMYSAFLLSVALLYIPDKPEFLKPFFDLGYVFIFYGGIHMLGSPHIPGGSDQEDFPTFKKWGRGLVSISKNKAKSVMRFVQEVGRRK